MKVSKPTIETAKTVLIAVLATGIVGFVGGMHYQHQTDMRVQSQAKAFVSQVTVKN